MLWDAVNAKVKAGQPAHTGQSLFFVGKASVELAKSGKMTHYAFCLLMRRGIFIASLKPSLSTIGVKFINKVKLQNHRMS